MSSSQSKIDLSSRWFLKELTKESDFASAAVSISKTTGLPWQPGPTLLGALKTIVDDCQEDRIHSVYSHENRVSLEGWCFNCYGFIDHFLLKHHPKAYEVVVQFMYANRERVPISIDEKPCPFHYAAFFKSLIDHKEKYWNSLQDFRRVLPGDLLVYLPRNYTPLTIVEMPTGRTGMHIMIVEEVLKIEADRVELTIIDCTRFRHCAEDLRTRGGIGRAPLTIHIPSTGVELQWGSREKKWEKDVFFGRLSE